MNRFQFLKKPGFLAITIFTLSSSAHKAEFTDEARKFNSINLGEVVEERLAKDELFNRQKLEIQTAIDSYFKKAIASGDIIGAGVSIVKGDSIVLDSGYGKRKVNESETINGQTVFRLGSISKGFAGVLAGKLKEEGKIDWNDKVVEYIPEFNFSNREFSEKITLSHILSHTSGAPYHSYTDLVESGLSLENIAPRFQTVKPISEPGKMYSYQNALFALSGTVMECATGETINEELDNYFFKPLGMLTASTDYTSLKENDNVAYPHRLYGKGWRSVKLTDKYFNAVAAGGVNASALDMAKWMRFLLGHNTNLMSKQALSEVFQPFIQVKGRSKYYQRWPGHVSSYYAFGWRIHKFKDENSEAEKTIIHHGGSVNHYRNEIAIYPEDDLGICVLFNSTPKIVSHVIPDLYEIVTKILSEKTEGNS
ncbi:serine hydrolase domain-containing protein [Aegicerativicinus sediminis]|uniref:serine hydrolase domain-containing protein n=1 Tax=Aegicerativicinus sediminis TaxID=2893202 RepID=UPI001E34F561|nr:serine hydrolase domain-containing protein [Aegicerativicinus sediminis]